MNRLIFVKFKINVITFSVDGNGSFSRMAPQNFQPFLTSGPFAQMKELSGRPILQMMAPGGWPVAQAEADENWDIGMRKLFCILNLKMMNFDV